MGAAPMALPRHAGAGGIHEGDSDPALPGWADVPGRPSGPRGRCPQKSHFSATTKPN